MVCILLPVRPKRRCGCIFILFLLLLTACYFDSRSGKIPNKLILIGLTAGIVCRLAQIVTAATASAEKRDFPDISAYWWYPLLFLGLYFCFTIGGLGAGDVKLYMVSALFLKPEQTIYFLLLSMGLAVGVFLLRLCKKRSRHIRLAAPMFAGFCIMLILGKVG